MEPIVVEVESIIDYSDLAMYAKSYPDKLAKLFAERCADDDMRPFVLDFLELACDADADGPDFREWVRI